MADFGGFGGMPPGLQGYLLTRQLNDQQSERGMLSSVHAANVISQFQQMADQKQARDALSNNDIPALLKTKTGIDMYRKMAESNNLGITGQLHSAQIGEINRKAATDAQELQARGALTNLVSSGGYQQNNPQAMPPTQVMQDPASAEAAAIAQYRKDPNTPFAIDVPNPANVRALAIASGSHLNRSAAASMLNPKDGSITPGAPPPGAAFAARAANPKSMSPTQPTPTQDLAPADKTALDIQSWNYLTKRVLPYRKASGGGEDRNGPVIKNAGDIALTLQKQTGMTAEELATLPETKQSDARSLYAQTKKVDMVQGVMNSFHYNLDTWENFAKGIAPKIGGAGVEALAGDLKKIDFIGVRSLDEAKLKIQQQFNDPTVSAYMIASMAVAMDYGRIMAGGSQSAAMTPEGARQEAVRLMSAGANDQGRKGIKAALESDAAGQIQGQIDQMNVTRDRLTGKSRGLPPPIPGSTPVPRSAVTSPSVSAPTASGGSVEFNGYRFPNQGAADAYKKAAGL